jgi:ATP-binding cassette subfamily F protein uup
MAPPLLLLSDIHLSFGGTALLTGATLSVNARDRLCLVGRNGSGKSTLLKVAANLIEADSGNRLVSTGATIRYLPQEPSFDGFDTIEAYVMAGLAPGDDAFKAGLLIAELGLDASRDPKTLSGGEGRRAALARTLAPVPDILLLDEPTNHLDLPTIEWLEGHLRSMSSALVLISHDRRFLENLSTACIWLDRGTTRRMDKSFAGFEDWRDQVLAEEEAAHHKLARRIAAEEHWVRYGVTARRKRNQGRMRGLAELRATYKSRQSAGRDIQISDSPPPPSGHRVIEAKNLSKSYGNTLIVRDFSCRIMRGERIGLVGANGAGKTTLIRLLIGDLVPDGGTLKHGTHLEVATLDQHRHSLRDDDTVAEVLTEGRGDQVDVHGTPRHVIGYMQDFLFKPEQARTPVRVLSGGERARLLLARALARASNLLVLDEPTNDLDLETLDVLQDMLADYTGTALVVSHDRDFLDRVCTSVILAEGDGRFTTYAGGYTDMVNQRGAGVAGKAIATDKAPAKSAPRTASAPPAAKRKMSFKDKHALDTLPGEIDTLNQKIATLGQQMGDATLYTRDPAKFDTLSAALTHAQTALAAAEERWLELEMLREEIEG